jgi:ferric-dicitrate binding protein FerR (iron transport regulator)
VDNNQDHIDELIGKYLAGEAATEEIATVENWAAQSDENRQYVRHFETIFSRATSVKDVHTFDTDAAWERLRLSLAKKSDKTIQLPATPATAPPVWRWSIAASIVIALGIGLYLVSLRNDTTQKPVIVASNKQTVRDTLPDGSDVFLNKSTKLAYAYDKKKKEHRVKLQGEAFFNIQHDENKNFVIDIDGVLIKDIGTSFNVKAYPSSDLIEVVVEKGEVMFYTANDSGLYLKENGKGVYNKTTKRFTVDQPDENTLAYKTKVFGFNDVELPVIIKALNEVYDKQIVLRGNLQACRLTVSFHEETQEEIIAVITETLNLTVERMGDQIVLEGPGCEP